MSNKKHQDKISAKFISVFINVKVILSYIFLGVVRVHFPEATEQCVAEPIKSWLRHANERYEKKRVSCKFNNYIHDYR